MVSHDEVGISGIFTLVFLLELTLHGVIYQTLEAQQQVEEQYFLQFQGLQDPFRTDAILVSYQQAE